MTDTTLTQRDHDTTFRLQDQYLRGDVAGTVRTSRLFRTRYPRAATTTRLGPERSSTIATNLAPVLQHAQPPAVLPQANESCWCGSGRKYKRCHKPLEGRVLPGIVSPTLEVPAHIARPPYADTGRVERWAESRVKSPEIIERMRHAGAMAAEVLRLAGEMVAPGVTTDEIDRYVHQLTIDRGAYPSPLDRVLVQQVMQMGFDDTDPVHVAPHTVTDPLPGVSPDKQYLLQMSVGDAQVTNLATHLLARTEGLSVLGPALYVPYGLDEVDGPQADALVMFTEDPSPLPPTSNLLNMTGNEAHGELRKREAVVEQIRGFYATGEIVHTCGDGVVCDCSMGACGPKDPP